MATIEKTIDVFRGEEVIETYRIIDTDNFGGDYPNEKFIATGIQYKQTADRMADALNEAGGPHATRFYRVVRHVEIRYQLAPGFQP